MEQMSEAWPPDDRPEPDELELVYGDLRLAQDEIERLKRVIAVADKALKDQHIIIKSFEAHTSDLIAEIERLRFAIDAWEADDRYQRQLITELADALDFRGTEGCSQRTIAYCQTLLQRAREAGKG